ncbi:DUF4189 domain-containing protein [Nocardia caishijiensis]|uniref:Uncharacterized protein DUF4189 n=1 Tax=Nocardia caishijiensis TaxID=184756 RepID=A0ABQ6YF14_9NOCA|nr:DUF4189 domain-containing protein [Nocardia caishijiensis]KAF0836581.1 uncharacterized protein DUF4189 [Nocardia caishijiensis]
MNSRVRQLIRLTATALATAAPTIAFAAPALADSPAYGAIAISESTGITGSSWNFDSASDARSAAVDYCDISDCYAYVTVESGWCAAVARASNGDWSWARASNRAEATANAIGASSGPNPIVQTSVCQD